MCIFLFFNRGTSDISGYHFSHAQGYRYVGSRGLWCTNFGFGARNLHSRLLLGIIFSHILSLLLNIQIEKSDNFDPQFLKLALPLHDAPILLFWNYSLPLALSVANLFFLCKDIFDFCSYICYRSLHLMWRYFTYFVIVFLEKE